MDVCDASLYGTNDVQLVHLPDNSSTSPLSATAVLTVTVTDANDNSPNFVSVPVVSSIPEDIPVDSFIATVSAVDLDSGSNSEVSSS